MTPVDVPFAAQIGKLSRPLLQALRTILASVGQHGVWKDIPYANLTFGTGTAGTAWTVDQSDLFTARYAIVGDTLWYSVWLERTTVVGTPAYLTLSLPSRYTARASMANYAQLVDNGTSAPGAIYVGSAYGSSLLIARADSAALAASTNDTYVRFTATFQIVTEE